MADAPYYVYMLRCSDGSLYTGSTPNVARRLRQHCMQLSDGAKYTRSHPVTALEALWRTPDRSAALRLEARIKRLTREEKTALLQAPETLAERFPDTEAEHLPGASLEQYLPDAEPAHAPD